MLAFIALHPFASPVSAIKSAYFNPTNPASYGDMSIAEIKTKAKDTVHRDARGASALSLIKTARTQMILAKEFESKNELKGALIAYIKAANLASLTVDFPEYAAERGKGGIVRKEVQSFIEEYASDMNARAAAIEGMLKDTEKQYPADNHRVRPIVPKPPSLQDRMRVLQDQGLDISMSSKRIPRGSSIPPSSPLNPSLLTENMKSLDIAGFMQGFPSIDELNEDPMFNRPQRPKEIDDDETSRRDPATNEQPPIMPSIRDFVPMERPSSTTVPPISISQKLSNLAGHVVNKLPLPMTNSAFPDALHHYMRNLTVLLIDIRDREDFQHEHIKANAIVCIEPYMLLRENVSEQSLEDAMAITPKKEQSLFMSRDKFDLVVVYDQNSISFGGRSSPLNIFVRAIVENAFRRMLKRAPMMLVGGLDAWKKRFGDSEHINVSRCPKSAPLPPSTLDPTPTTVSSIIQPLTPITSLDSVPDGSAVPGTSFIDHGSKCYSVSFSSLGQSQPFSPHFASSVAISASPPPQRPKAQLMSDLIAHAGSDQRSLYSGDHIDRRSRFQAESSYPTSYSTDPKNDLFVNSFGQPVRMDNTRAARLEKLFAKILGASDPIPANQKDLFIDAICVQDDKASCISRLVASKNGIPSISAALRYDCSDTFANGGATNLLKYFMAPEIEGVSGGSYLEKILVEIVIPPIFWEALSSAFDRNLLIAEAETCFAWLMYKLISFQTSETDLFRAIAREKDYIDKFLNSSSHETKKYAQQIKHLLETGKVPTTSDGGSSAGGRHDNDFLDFREISIIPTVGETLSSKEPFLRTTYFMDDSSTKDDRVSIYLDNQFRLLREDMLSEMREELHVALGKTKRQYKPHVYEGLQVLDIRFGPDNKKRTKWALRFELGDDLPAFKNKSLDANKRVEYLRKHRRILSHQSPACLIVDDELVAFALVDRDETELAENPPLISLQLEGENATSRTLSKLKSGKDIGLISVDVAVFAYEPILRAIQRTKGLPLAQELLFWETSALLPAPKHLPYGIIAALRVNPCQDLQSLIGTQNSITLDKSQGESFLNGLTQRVSLIQGPPGTGKSFIGALLAKTIHDHTSQSILVVCYTNHALDQFLEDLLDIGIPANSIARLGGTAKATSRTVQLALQNQESTFRFLSADYKFLNALKDEIEQKLSQLESLFQSYQDSSTTLEVILGWLKSKEPDIFNAFQVPLQEDGMVLVHNKNPSFLFYHWLQGRPPHYFPELTEQYPQLWAMKQTDRQFLVRKWEDEIEKEKLSKFYSVAKQYNELIRHLQRKFTERDRHTLQNKRIIGSTTTAAAKYAELLQSVSPSVLIVEEAGEILESHILTALGREKNQLILIGDHKQLRPRVKSYPLTVEKGDGFDLNRSLFERLVLKGYPHTTLSQQYRMRPEISALVRHLTYPDLIDAPRTQSRPNLRGVTDNLIMIHHNKPEDEMTEIEDRAEGAKSSKQNTHEVQMVLKIVRYLGQQGYGTDNMVVLTPYLGQLQKLMMALKSETDPVLNDLDSHELVRAGLLSQADANARKRPLRLATIDNYQGEESDIVIVSLTRSNPENDIGFMSSPERVNVMLSRARNALIMIGNTHTFQLARRGRELWTSLLDLLKKGGHIYEGLPVRCERHPKKTTVLKTPENFDNEAPDGGCKQPCGILMDCGIHPCQVSCHQTTDHSRMRCRIVVGSMCSNGHDTSYYCHTGPSSICLVCEKERRLVEKQQRDDLARKKKREQKEKDHELKMADFERQMQAARQDIRDAQIAAEREQARRRMAEEVQKAQELATKARQMRNSSVDSGSFLSMLLSPSIPVPNPADSSSQPTQSPTSPTNVIPKDRHNRSFSGDLGCDPSVPDYFWHSLQEASRKREEIEHITRAEQAELGRQKAERKREEEEIAWKMRELEEQARRVDVARYEADRKRMIQQKEAERFAIKRARERNEGELREKKKEEEERRQREAQIQWNLQLMGACPLGYQWLPQRGGYRCGCGSHWVSNAQLGI